MQTQRFKQIPVENLSADQRALYDAIKSGPRSAVKNSAAAKPGPLGGPFNVLLRTPQVGELSQQLGNAIRFSSGLSGRLRELATLMAAFSKEKLEDGRARLVRHGHLPEREGMTGIGPVPVKVPRVRDRKPGEDKITFTPPILLRYLR